MNMTKSIKLIEKYANCPKCGNEYIGNGQGGLVVENNTFRRFCSCGFDVTLNSDGEEIETIKIDIELPVKGVRLLKEFLGCQMWEDTFDIITKYNLDILPDDMDDIMHQIFRRVEEVL